MRKLKRSAGQLIKIIKCSGTFLFMLSSAYFVLSLISLLKIDVDDFARTRLVTKHSQYAVELYWYSL